MTMARIGARRLLGAAVTTIGLTSTAPASGDESVAPRVWFADEGVRVRREVVDHPAANGSDIGIWKPGRAISLTALRGEVVAFQVLVQAGTDSLREVEVEIGPWRPDQEQAPGPGSESPVTERFVEHYLEVRTRSRNDARPDESLGWSPAARPADADLLGWIPDALIPVDVAPAWAPYPLAVPPRENRAVWVDVFVPRGAAPGVYRSTVTVTTAAPPLRVEALLTVHPAVLPYRPVSFFAYYDPHRSLPRIGEERKVEQQLWQLLHAHHIDAAGTILSQDDARALEAGLDGRWFRPDSGYRGPGVGVGPEVVPIGIYGQLRDPGPGPMGVVESIVPTIPAAASDVFVYAIDETCDSPRGPTWRKLLAASEATRRIKAGHTCGRDPSEQDVDIVLMPAVDFSLAQAERARRSGKRVWIYNGYLPRTGAMNLDAPLTSLTLDGWIAASRPIDRWFLWETTFWHDRNRGGHGSLDPFVTAENFHNGDGDAELGDGLLLYPGRQNEPPGARSVGIAAVLPSMRLKSLRRGIQDAGYIALARLGDRARVDAIVQRVVPRALDEIATDTPPTFLSEPQALASARSEIRALIPDPAPDPDLAVTELRRAQGSAVGSPARARLWPLFLALAGLGGAIAALRTLRKRRPKTAPR